MCRLNGYYRWMREKERRNDLMLDFWIERIFKDSISNHNLAISPNRINQDFYATAPNQAYVGDITYIATKGGWLYLATVIDRFARPVLGWAMDDSMHTDPIVLPLRNARSK